ncbi:MAG: hypothetical protein IIC82_05270 [Chloroflexi bacterium]|nr:hypothetical protein [Chloroflexota bacterium]
MPIELGSGATRVEEACGMERAYRMACVEALRGGQLMPPSDGLPSLVASYVRYWALQAFGRADPVAEGDVPVYHVPARGWSLLLNGVSLVVCSRQSSPDKLTRVVAVFKSPPKEKPDVSAMLVVSRQAKGWLATFREEKE